MDVNYRMKAKIGENEFDAEGPAELVRKDYEAFLETVKSSAAKVVEKPVDVVVPLSGVEAVGSVGNVTPRIDASAVDSGISRIMRVDKRTVSLTAAPANAEEAVLLLLYGQRVLRNNESPTGTEIVAGVATTGGLDIGRSDRMFEKIARNGDVIMIGERRGKRYRLTNAGIAKARQIAASMLALIA